MKLSIISIFGLLLTLANLLHANDLLGIVPLPTQTKPVPHLDVTGPQAEWVSQALNAILKSQNLPVPSNFADLDIPNLSCSNLWVPIANVVQGYSCQFDYSSNGTTLTLSVKDASVSQPLAKNLFAALNNAGVVVRTDPAHGAFIFLKKLERNQGQVSFDDYSTYTSRPSPNVQATGASAQNLLMQFASLGIKDSDDTLLVICNNYDHKNPSCSLQIHQALGPSLSPAQSSALWTETYSIAKDSEFSPVDGTLDQMTILNADYFTYDGTTLSFRMIGGCAVPPPPSPH